MKQISIHLLMTLCLGYFSVAYAQETPISPSKISTGTYYGLTPSLLDLPAITEAEYRDLVNTKFTPNEEEKKERSFPFASTAKPEGPDPVWQDSPGKLKSTGGNLDLTFDGITSPYSVSDCNGAIGPEHYMLTINSLYAIYDKEGNILAGPTNMNLLFGSVPGANCNDGDPIIIYDEDAERWLAGEFSLCGSTDRMLVAVSTTDDPTGTWHQYSFDVADMPDYEKFGVWRDAYYMGTNTSSGTDIYAFERDQMLEGGTAQMIAFDNAWKPNASGLTVPPLDNDGTLAPEGSPGLFIAINDDAWGGSTDDQIWIHELVADWDEPSNSTFTKSQSIDVSPFDSDFGPTWSNIIQPGTSQKLDGLIGWVMNRPQYRNFGTYETIVLCHTVDVDQTDHAGVRWYELRREDGGDWTIRQEGTYAPDEHSRWMASIVLNGQNELGIGYSISSDTEYPGLRVTGQSAEEYANASGILNFAEDTLHLGTQSQTNSNRWGDYFNTSIDPLDDQTFWFAGEYKNGSGKKTKVGSFKFSPLTLTAAFSADKEVVCTGGDVSFTNLSFGYPIAWSWSFPGGTPDSYEGEVPPMITYSEVGSYDVTLIVSDGTDEDIFIEENYIEVKEVIADFMAESTEIVVEGAANFTDISQCDPDSWEWEFEGGLPATYSGQTPPPIVYNTIGVYDVTLTVTKGEVSEVNTKSDYIVVEECSLCPSEYSDTYYDWISNVTLNTINNNSESVGYEDYTDISTTLSAGSTYPMFITISVNGSWVQHGKAWFDWNQDCLYDDATEGYYFGEVNGTETLSIDIEVPTNAVAGYTTMRVSELWEDIPPPCGGGTYGETEDYTIIVLTEGLPPVSCMAAEPTTGVAPLTVEFSDCSENDPVTWSWDFGDGGTSEEQNPNYNYEEPGLYTVSLTTTNEYGSNTVTHEDYIEILLTGIRINAALDGVSIYPNPVNDLLTVDFTKSEIENASIEIHNISGEVVYTREGIPVAGGNYTVDVSGFEDGLYFVTIKSEEKSIREKVTILR